MRMLLAGNWKMNGVRASLAEIRALGRALADEPTTAHVLVCPPASLIAEAVKAAEGTAVSIGGQDCHALASGPFTGDISPEMLRDAGATSVILGHSERRQFHGETSTIVAAKTKGARRAGLHPIVCVGETESERTSGRAIDVVTRQLEGSLDSDTECEDLAVAYEPVWAIGTGKTPSMGDIAQMHDAVRAALLKRFGTPARTVKVLYGGSVKPDNAIPILAIPNVDGALIGGASLKAADFLAIIRSAPKR